MNAHPSAVTPASWTATNAGCPIAAVSRASRTNRALSSGSDANRACSTLIATSRRSTGWRARYTAAIPPTPSNGPSTLSAITSPVRRSGQSSGSPGCFVSQSWQVEATPTEHSGVRSQKCPTRDRNAPPGRPVAPRTRGRGGTPREARRPVPHTPPLVARGPGPRWLRLGLAMVAVLYYLALVKRPPPVSGLRALTFFTQATCLFPAASTYAIEFRLEGWSCDDAAWRPLDPAPYFPIEHDSKESRFQRIGYFYQRNRPVMRALDAWLVARVAATTGAGDRLGGIRVVKVLHPLPAPGAPVARYAYDPLGPINPEARRDMYWTRSSERRARCTVAR